MSDDVIAVGFYLFALLAIVAIMAMHIADARRQRRLDERIAKLNDRRD
jgi:hypothetical protein